MAFSSKYCFTSSNNISGAQIQTKQIVGPNIVDFISIPATLKRSTANNFTLATRQQTLSYPNNSINGIEPEQLGVFKHMLINQNANDPLEGLAIIDAMQRLGIDYLFQEEIEATLQEHYMGFSSHVHVDDLHEIALRFRLLRQEGYYVPAGVFNKFKDRNGEFKQNLSDNIQGLMSLYEASQLAIRGECVLEEAADYSYQLLNSMVMTHIDHQQARIVKHTLENPHHKNLARFMATNFFYDLQGGNQWINVLQDLAKFESKVVQHQHQQEILHISNWWKDLGLSKELQFARDQPVKWHMWPMACLTDPKFSKQRIEITKAISFIYIIDDIFDVYGTLDELTVFTEVVNRWETAAMESLPYSMKICFEALDKITNEISYNVFKDHGWNPVHSIRKAWASLCNAFLAEARWFASGDIPKAEEYLKNGIVSSGVHVVLVHFFFLLGQGITRENVQLIENNPGIISSTATILRLWDDLGSAKDEEQDGHDGSYVECYMKEHQGSSVEDARKHVKNIISEEWKHLNEECLSPNPFSQTFTKATQNLPRMIPLMYDYDDKHRLPILEEYMKFLLHESVSCCFSTDTPLARD